jgi:Putative Flp pilus-assembly TadE/G-like
MTTPRSSEKGQALVLLVLAFVVLLGFTALAIDGGMVYADRRHAQNGADAASLAGGGAAALYMENNYVDYEDFSCDPNNYPDGYETWQAQSLARAAAVSRAGDNDFVIDEDMSDNNGVATRCGITDTGGWIDKYVDITTTITADTQTNFAHFIYSGPLRNTVRAVTRVRPKVPFGLGYAIVALRPDCPNSNTGGVSFNGNNNVTVYGGGVFSNACIRAGGSVQVYIDQGSVCTGSGCYMPANASVDVSPQPTEATIPLPTFSLQVPTPDCDSLPLRGNHTGGGTIDPGRYGRIRVNAAGDDLLLNPGLYCIANEFTMNGGSVAVYRDPGGPDVGVTIYMTGGDFTVNGGVHVTLTPPPNMPNACDYCPPAIPGMLLYMDPSNAGVITLNGDSTSDYMGTVYAPSGRIDAGGNELAQVRAQLVADTVDVQGNTVINVNVDSALQFRPPASLELYR